MTRTGSPRRSRALRLGVLLATAVSSLLVAILSLRPESQAHRERPKVTGTPRHPASSVARRAVQLEVLPAPRAAHGPRESPELPAAPDDERIKDHPLSELAPTEAESRMLYEAEEVGVESCMKRRGFTYDRNQYESNAERDPWRQPVHEGDVEAAQAFGYGLADSIEVGVVPLPMDPNEARLAASSPEQRAAWHDALMGPPTDPTNTDDPAVARVQTPLGTLSWNRGSCLAEARRLVYGDDVELAEREVAEQSMRQRIREQARQDPEYVAAIERWRGCGRKQGLAFEEPREAARALYEQYSQGSITLEQLRERELNAATADALCDRQEGVHVARTYAEKRAEHREREANGPLIGVMHRSFSRALTQAAQLTSSGQSQASAPSP